MSLQVLVRAIRDIKFGPKILLLDLPVTAMR